MVNISKYASYLERCSLQYRNKEFKDLGLSGNHHMFIFYISRNPGCNQDSLVSKLHINKSNIARSIKVLMDDGFIYREVDDNDKRAYKLFPTSKALEFLPEIRKRIRVFNEHVLVDLSEEEQELLDSVLYKVAINASQYVNQLYDGKEDEEWKQY